MLIIFCLIAPSVHGGEILVAAAASLTDALTEVKRAYERERPTRVRLVLGASSTLARQIIEGAPADVFFSADLEKLERLESAGLVQPGSRRNFLSNQLVMVAPGDSSLVIASPKDLVRTEVKRVALAEPSSVPAGIYARKYLEKQGIWAQVRGKVIPVGNVRAVLVTVELGNVDVGFVYGTDAKNSSQVRIVYEVPMDQGPRIVYPVAILKGSERKVEARDFLDFVLSDAGRRIFQKRGFVWLR